MAILEIGKLYVSGKTQWPETIEYNYDANGHTILICLRSPTSKEVQGLKNDSLDLALHYADRIPTLLWRVGEKGQSLPWSDCAFNWYLVPPERRQIPEIIQDGQQALLNILLVDADTGILKVFRVISMPTKFSRSLVEAILEQINGGEISSTTYAQVTYELQVKYSSDELQRLAQVKCHIPKPDQSGKPRGFG
jgi:hypothetical protein